MHFMWPVRWARCSRVSAIGLVWRVSAGGAGGAAGEALRARSRCPSWAPLTCCVSGLMTSSTGDACASWKANRMQAEPPAGSPLPPRWRCGVAGTTGWRPSRRRRPSGLDAFESAKRNQRNPIGFMDVLGCLFLSQQPLGPEDFSSFD
ncbi:Protein of unknown function [Gryllus bimaculatus]|nr:Protein of unknown function [Gryllus bimaculatus]